MGITLAEIETFSKIDFRVEIFLDNMNIDTYENFIQTLYKAIDYCVVLLQDKRIFLQPDAKGEDRVSADLRDSLSWCLFTADAKFVGGGNTDLTITSFNKKFKWIGEAKLVHGVNNLHIWDGFLQLVTRYASGDEPQGGVLVYIFAQNAKHIMDSYRTYTQEKAEYSFIYEDCKSRLAGGFYTTHKHVSSGLDFKTRYIPVILHHAPLK